MIEPPSANLEAQKNDRTAYRFSWRYLPLGAQILCIAFGALVLVPILTGLNPNVALLTAGLGTLVFQWVTGGKVPVFLASSFAFIAPIQLGVEKYGLAETLSGLMAAGVVYLLLSLLILWRGSGFLLRLLPPVVTGPVIMVIGLSLAPIAIDMASNAGEGYSAGAALAVSGSALLATLLTVLFSRGWLKLVPILAGLLVGYLVAFPFGMVDLTPIAEAPWFALPQCTLPRFHLPSILFIVPVAIAPAIEHFGDILAISAVAQKDYFRDPGIHRTLLGDGLATSLAACLGGPPNTTYSEVTGAIALIKLFNAGIMTWAAILAILLAFFGKLGAFLRSIPVPAMGGILVILFGTIVVVGMNSLVRSGDDLMKPRNLTIVAIILVFGVGGLSLKAGEFALQGIGLCGIFGVLLNGLLPNE
ncbi:uracil-xanthine permease family protein [Roseofilum sp. BLCC_M154]|uniref:Uracil-xanthine permease family protein n=1 Tax=Roseofilum acuticapitatum BLCC-M154 TaxID=3022444 RepID=A0ABT7AUN6_9CYAN|nr:uracil-xanthine permease family protein [Roseofilum acuticapitatum]MDJ1170625.1 uracil-xanthine permease family protein [Roseofilum acuticapitatum BLCC-M154]